MCPDFPSKKGLDPAVWTNAKAGQIDAAISGRAPASEYDTQLDANVSTRAPASEYDTQLDANVSTRAPSSEYDTEMARLDTDVSTRSSHNAAAVATEILVDPGTDKIDGSQIDASVASRAPSSEYDTQLDANVSTRAPSSEYDTEMAKVLEIPYFEAPVEGSLLMDASLQVLVEKTDDKAGLLEGMINLAPMEAGDTVVVTESMQTISTGTYAVYAQETYSGVQAVPLLQILTRISTHDIKVEIQQTAGTNRTFEYSFVRRRET